jgi:hypothetical protein
MPWIKIAPDRLQHLPLFGIDFLKDDGAFSWYRGSKGRMRVEKANPCVFVDDEQDAIQLGAEAILVAGDN